MTDHAPEAHPSGVSDPSDDPQTNPAPDAQGAAEDEAIRENAGTSLDQPSEDVD